MAYNYGYNGPASAVIDTGGKIHIPQQQKTAVLHAEPPSMQTNFSPYTVTYLNPVTTQPAAGQVMVAPTRCQAQYPVLMDLGQAYSSSVGGAGGGQCQPCKAAGVASPEVKQAPPKRVNRCCPGCGPCCCGECDATEDSPAHPCCMCGTGCCGCQHATDGHQAAAAAPPSSSSTAPAHQDCCSCHGCQTNCCGQPCCVCHPCQTNNCCGNQGGCCGNMAATSSKGTAPSAGCCGGQRKGGCCGPNNGCCGPNGECCGPNGGCCGNCCQPVQAKPAAAADPLPAVVTTQPTTVDVGQANLSTPPQGPYVYRTSYNLAGFVPYTGQAVSVVPIDSRFSWGGAAIQPYTNVAKQVFT